MILAVVVAYFFGAASCAFVLALVGAASRADSFERAWQQFREGMGGKR